MTCPKVGLAEHVLILRLDTSVSQLVWPGQAGPAKGTGRVKAVKVIAMPEPVHLPVCPSPGTIWDEKLGTGTASEEGSFKPAL